MHGDHGREGRPVLSDARTQAEGHEIITTEGLGTQEQLHPVQRAFKTEHGLQCGFCTPGFVCAITAMLDDIDDMSEDELRDALSGNICRCTGYANIVNAARRAATDRAEAEPIQVGKEQS